MRCVRVLACNPVTPSSILSSFYRSYSSLPALQPKIEPRIGFSFFFYMLGNTEGCVFDEGAVGLVKYAVVTRYTHQHHGTHTTVMPSS